MTEPIAPAPLLSVRGEANLRVDPEIARLSVTIAARDKDRQRTLAQLAHRSENLRGLLDQYSEAIEGAETARAHVRPEYRDNRKPNEKILGYVGSITSQITIVDFTIIGELVLRLSDADLTTVDGPWWSLRIDSGVYRQARRIAARAAVERAREYAEALGATIVGLREFSDTGLSTVGDQPWPKMEMMRGMAMGAAADQGRPELNLEPAVQEVHAEVEARFLISQPTDL